MDIYLGQVVWFDLSDIFGLQYLESSFFRTKITALEMATEIEETESFLSTAIFPGVQLVLQNHLNKLRKEEENKTIAAAAKAAKAAAESEVASTIATKVSLSNL